MCSISSSKATPSPSSMNQCLCDCDNTTKPSEDLNFTFPEGVRKYWDKWDMRILVLYILFTQLSLYLLGRRRKSMVRILMVMNVWLLYLFSDLLATIGLGKLSKASSPNSGKPPRNNNVGNKNHHNNGDTDPISLLRGLWAPIILFYLGGPDTLIVLKLEENHMWMRHLVGLLTQSLRTGYVLFATWARSWLSLLALLMLFPAIIKYGERVWVMKLRARAKYEGFVQLDESRIALLDKVTRARPNVKLVLQAYSYFQTLKPHMPSYERDTSKLDNLVADFRERVRSGSVHNAFKLIEIELGFMYDVLFSKVGTIFTVWGCILRFISFSCVVGVLVGFFLVKKPGGDHLKVDLPITIILLLGAIFLEVAGVLEQLLSDWAVVWAYKHQSKVVAPVFRFQEFVISKTKRESEPMGQFTLLNFGSKYNKLLTKCDGMMERLCGRETILKMKFSSPLSEVRPVLKALIINHLLEVEVLQTSNLKRGERTLLKHGCLQVFNWSIHELEFDESIVIWHTATDICYHSEDPNSLPDEVEPTKILSYYMMHLLLKCRPRLPICNTNVKLQACYDVEKFFEGEPISSNAQGCKLLLDKQSDSRTVNHIKKLAGDLMENQNRWKIMSDMWVEMLCYAASYCPVKHHVQELRDGGEFLTHVWLLLIHFGVIKELEQNGTPILPGNTPHAADVAVKGPNIGSALGKGILEMTSV